MKVNRIPNTEVFQITLAKCEAVRFVRDLEDNTSHIALGIVDDAGDQLKSLLESKQKSKTKTRLLKAKTHTSVGCNSPTGCINHLVCNFADTCSFKDDEHR